MKIYLVGGAVRDSLLGLSPKEKDYVVVGATVHDMLSLGFRQVGKDFPVFLHPETHEEYALARTERKTGPGYKGFAFDADPSVTLEDDLKRRDVTINAMATPLEGGDIIDPYHGREDLKQGVLRHVSPAFAEDPVRILRIGRFAARFGFTVHPDTLALMQFMVEKGEVDALVAERVWKELERALLERYPEKFFDVLTACGANSILFPALTAEGMAALKRAARNNESADVRFAALLDGLTSDQIKTLCKRYRVPSDFQALALLLNQFSASYANAEQLRGEDILSLLFNLDAFRRENRFNTFLRTAEVCRETPGATVFLKACFNAAKNITYSTEGEAGPAIAEKIKSLRLAAIQHYMMNPDNTGDLKD